MNIQNIPKAQKIYKQILAYKQMLCGWDYRNSCERIPDQGYVWYKRAFYWVVNRFGDNTHLQTNQTSDYVLPCEDCVNEKFFEIIKDRLKELEEELDKL